MAENLQALWDATPAAPAASENLQALWDATPTQKTPLMRGSATGGVIETGLTGFTGLLSSSVGGLAGLVGTLIPGERGQGARVSRYIQEKGTYQPRTQQGQAMTSTLALPFELAAEGTGRLGELIGGPAAGRTIGEAIPEIAATLLPGPKMFTAAKARGAQQAAQQMKVNIARSYDNAPQIEAAQTAQLRGFALNPSVSNPTAATKTVSAIAGKEADTLLGQKNVTQTVKLVKEDLGLKSTDKLDANSVNKALTEQSKPYDVVRNVDVQVIPDSAAAALDSAKIPVRPHNVSAATAVNTLIDSTRQDLYSGQLRGTTILDDIRQLRRDALEVYKARDKGLTVPDPEKVAVADAKMAIADAYEQVLEANVKNPNDVAAMRAARARMAQTYDHLRALDFATGKIDPQAYVKMFNERQGKMTGVGADIAKVAANYPSVMSLAEATPFTLPRLVRGGVGATVGAAIGSLAFPILGPAGTVAGLAAGAGSGYGAGRLMARRMATPEFQARYAVPPDYRPPVVNALAPAPANTLPVVATAQGQVLRPGEYPNWTYGRNPREPDIRVGTPAPTQPQLPPPSGEQTMQNVLQGRRGEYTAEEYAAQLAAQRAAETEAAQRVPSSGGQIYDLDPITGRLKSASEGLKGATPDTITSTGHTLASAVDKLSSGQAFALSAEERVAWAKSKTDLASVAPTFSKLSDKAIAERMMDRQWVSDAVTKAREQARGFDEIAKRAENTANSRAASIQRDRLMDLAEALDERLSIMPSVKPKAQGPKTRAAQRNALRGDDENQNRLAPQ